MSKKDYKVNEVVKVIYKGTAGITSVDMQIFDEVDALVTTVSMSQLGSSKRWTSSFTPDAEGDWHVEVDDSVGGEIIKHFSVGQYNITEIGANLQSTENKIDIIDTKIDGLDFQSPPMIG